MLVLYVFCVYFDDVPSCLVCRYGNDEGSRFWNGACLKFEDYSSIDVLWKGEGWMEINFDLPNSGRIRRSIHTSPDEGLEYMWRLSSFSPYCVFCN